MAPGHETKPSRCARPLGTVVLLILGSTATGYADGSVAQLPHAKRLLPGHEGILTPHPCRRVTKRYSAEAMVEPERLRAAQQSIRPEVIVDAGRRPMPARSIRETVTFIHAFRLGGTDRQQPAGTHTVDMDEELIGGFSSLAYRRATASILLPRQLLSPMSAASSAPILPSWRPPGSRIA